MTDGISIRACYRGAALRVLRNYPWFALGLGGGVLAWLIVEWIVILSPLSTSRIAWWMAHIGYFFLTALPEVMLLRMGDNLVTGRRPSQALDVDPVTVVRYTLIKFIVAPVFIVGLALLVIPGLYAGARMVLSGPSAVVESRTVLGALKRGWRLSRGRTGPLMKVVGSLVLLNLAGLALMGAGLLLTLPISYVVIARMFRLARGEAADAAASPRMEEDAGLAGPSRSQGG